MKRRAFVTAVGMSLLVAPLRLTAQSTQRVPHVGYLFSFIPAEGRHLWEACRHGLRELGYVEGQNIVLEPRWADGRHERLPELAAELVRLRMDVIVSAATPASRAAKAATSSIPIVIVGIGEPVKMGLIANLARPGGNITGISLLTAELSGKRLDLLAQVVRSMPRVAIFMNSDNPVHGLFLEETRIAAQKLGAQLQLLEARNRKEIEVGFDAGVRGRAAGLVMFDDPGLSSHRKRFVALAAQRRLPAVYRYRDFTEDGGLMSYGPDRIDHYRASRPTWTRSSAGAKPADLPVEQPNKCELIINTKTAKALGLAIPRSLFQQTDQVIE